MLEVILIEETMLLNTENFYIVFNCCRYKFWKLAVFV